MHTDGLHHVTAVAGDSGKTRRSYAGVLGPRPVGRTVDDTATYRPSRAGEAGEPGVEITRLRFEGGDAE